MLLHGRTLVAHREVARALVPVGEGGGAGGHARGEGGEKKHNQEKTWGNIIRARKQESSRIGRWWWRAKRTLEDGREESNKK